MLLLLLKSFNAVDDEHQKNYASILPFSFAVKFLLQGKKLMMHFRFPKDGSIEMNNYKVCRGIN